MEVEVPDALTAVRAARVEDNDSARPEALNHGPAHSLHQRDGLGEVVSRRVEDTYAMRRRHDSVCPGASDPSGSGKKATACGSRATHLASPVAINSQKTHPSMPGCCHEPRVPTQT